MIWLWIVTFDVSYIVSLFAEKCFSDKLVHDLNLLA